MRNEQIILLLGGATGEKIKKVFDETALQQSVWTGLYMDKHVEESMAWSKKEHNVEVIELTAEEQAEWDKRLEPISGKWVADAKAKGLPAEAILADIMAFGAMYAGK